MVLGAFSVSLAVKDLGASREFYAKLGFEVIGGEASQGWQILRNGKTTIGIFQGMFEGNVLTFNPGWGPLQEELNAFPDVREIQADLLGSNIELHTQADSDSTGPASISLLDPDGNAILIDQHVG